MPYQFLRRILQRLVKAGLVESRKGAGGGFRLCADPAAIHVADVIRKFQGAVELSECMFRKKICENRATCVLRREIKRIERLVTVEFEKLTIQRLMKKTGNRGGGR